MPSAKFFCPFGGRLVERVMTTMPKLGVCGRFSFPKKTGSLRPPGRIRICISGSAATVANTTRVLNFSFIKRRPQDLDACGRFFFCYSVRSSFAPLGAGLWKEPWQLCQSRGSAAVFPFPKKRLVTTSRSDTNMYIGLLPDRTGFITVGQEPDIHHREETVCLCELAQAERCPVRSSFAPLGAGLWKES